MILANKPSVAHGTRCSVTELEYKACGAGLCWATIVQMLQQRFLDVVTFPNEQPGTRIGKPVDTRQSRDKVTHSGCVKGPGRHLVKRQR